MTDEPLVAYPEGQVLAAFESGADARQALDEMRDAGLGDAELRVYAGDGGEEALDSDGTQHGLTGVVVRGIQLLMTDRDRLSDYEGMVHEGGVVLAIHADGDDEKKHQIADILHHHDGQYVRYYGSFTVEDVGISDNGAHTT